MTSATATVSRIERFAIVTADPNAAAAFFKDAFGAAFVEQAEGGEALAHLLGVPGTKIATTALRIGAQTIELLSFDPRGRPYPTDSDSSDLWFQHLAIIVSDIEAAYARLHSVGRFTPISTAGPQRLPPASGSVTAFKFRDAEGHPLELLEFTPNAGPEIWRRRRSESLFLGIDHSAVAVGDADGSIAFFASAFGLTCDARNENRGPEQAALDGLPEARVAVVGLQPQSAPPHLELLGYEVGRRRPIDAMTRSNDVAATQIVFETESLDPIVAALTDLGTRFVSPGVVTLEDGSRGILVLDPDGHRLRVVERRRTWAPGRPIRRHPRHVR